jgi:small conductance mechanosensitive channel
MTMRNALPVASPHGRRRPFWPLLIAALLLCLGVPVSGQTASEPAVAAPDPAEAAASRPIDIAALNETSDQAVAEGLRDIFAQVEGLGEVAVAVRSGVVTLSGTVRSQADRQKAEAIAVRVSGVVSVQNSIDRTFEVDGNVSPVFLSFDDIRALIRSLPLFGVAFLIAIVIAALGHLLARQGWLWQWVAPNAFLADLIAGAIRVAAVIAGVVAALRVLDATGLLNLVIGSAGIIGIALGFAVRDTVDNYVSSLMLSLRQPFRANDHVMIDDREGRVIRLTSRATVLMTLDGNHLRIPNATVFKANLLNYTRNPQRRFEFDLGVSSDGDPIGAMQEGVDAMRALPFVLDDPKSHAVIHTVGESSIVLRFFGWVDQRDTDFAKGRSLAIQAAKQAVEQAGYELPEPIYRIRIDQQARSPVETPSESAEQGRPKAARPPDDDSATPDRAVEKLVTEERSETSGKDLLDSGRPTE